MRSEGRFGLSRSCTLEKRLIRRREGHRSDKVRLRMILAAVTVGVVCLLRAAFSNPWPLHAVGQMMVSGEFGKGCPVTS